MNSKLFFDTLPSTVKGADVNFEQSVETEILLADYDAPVFKIVKTTMQHLITQKYVLQGKLTTEGFIKINIWYQSPESSSLNVISQKIPFHKQLETGQYDINYIDIQGHCQYVNTRPQNPTRIDVRGAYLFNIRMYSRQNTEIITAISADTVCCDSAEIDSFALSGQNIRQFTLENQLSLPENAHRILSVHTTLPSPALSVYTDKVTAKGEVNADIYYTSEDSDSIMKHSQSFVYNQIVDMPDIMENNIPCASVSVASLGISQNSETKGFVANTTVQIDMAAFAKQQVMAVCDGFSRRFEYDITSQQQLADTNMHIVDKNVQVTFGDIANSGQICHILLETAPAKSYFEINKTTVKSKVTAHIIVKNAQGEYECISKAEDVVFDWLEKCGRYDEICIDVSAVGHTYTDTSVTATLSVKGFVIEKQTVQLLKAFAENREKPLQDIDEALVIYYGKRGERVFDIAKSHGVSPQVIMDENGLEDGVLAADSMLFIPAFEQ